MSDLGDLIKRRRKDLKLSLTDVAMLMADYGYAVNRNTVHHWETGRNDAPVANDLMVEALARTLEVDQYTVLQAAGVRVNTESRSADARLAAEIVEALPPKARQIAIEQLKVLLRTYYRPDKP
jgi:transcriptional regulator with XRE-family HTH domain